MARAKKRGAAGVLQWLAENDETAAGLAARIGVNRSVVWRWLHDADRSPSLRLAVRVEDVTGVPASSWHPSRRDAA
jgi:transcriptional regulator with XRE-family HTH domain